jgi:hypothetical protein
MESDYPHSRDGRTRPTSDKVPSGMTYSFVLCVSRGHCIFSNYLYLNITAKKRNLSTSCLLLLCNPPFKRTLQSALIQVVQVAASP